jgi:hypothetical protein
MKQDLDKRQTLAQINLMASTVAINLDEILDNENLSAYAVEKLSESISLALAIPTQTRML